MTVAPASIDAFRRHGGRIDLARRVFPGAPDAWIDLSTGIAPRAYRHAAVAGDARRLPSPDALAALEAAAAAAFGVGDPGTVVAVAGSELGLRLVGVALAPRSVAVVGPGYGGHPTAWGDAAVTVVDDVGGGADRDVTVHANPNNPDGRRIDRARLSAIAGPGWLVVDEAFADADPGDSLAPLGLPGVVVLRSFGKFYGLPGLRLGFVVAAPAVATRLRSLRGDWPVATPVLRVATAAYRDTAWQARQRRFLDRSAARLDRALVAAGFAIVGGTALFRLARHPDADRRFLSLAAAGILTRPFASGSGLLRFGVPGGTADWHRLAAALKDFRR